MLDEIGALWVDHLAVTTADFEATCASYMSIPGARLLRGPGWNPDQEVRFAFIQTGADLTIEVLGLPDDGGGPIAGHVEKGGGVYHLCYAVADIDAAAAKAQGLGAKLVVEPRADAAFDGRRVAFLIHASVGLFELVEAYGDFSAPRGAAAAPKRDGKPAAGPRPEGRSDDAPLLGAFQAIFPTMSPDEIAGMSVETAEKWDSLAHLRLLMEIERRFDLKIPSQRFGELTSFAAIETYLSQTKA